MLCFAKNVRNVVGLYEFPVVVCIMVNVLGGVGGRGDGKICKCVSLGLGFLQVVTAVVPATLQVAFIGCYTGDYFSSRTTLPAPSLTWLGPWNQESELPLRWMPKNLMAASFTMV